MLAKTSMTSLFQGETSKKKDPYDFLDPASIHLRLRGLSPAEYPIDLDRDTRDTIVSRAFLSENYGGGRRNTIPSIGKRFLLAHGTRHWLYPNLKYNPYAPGIPGHLGLFFQARGVPEIVWRNVVYRVITRVAVGQWLYMGQYQVDLTPSSVLSGGSLTKAALSFS